MINPSVNRAFRPGNFFGTNIQNGAYTSAAAPMVNQPKQFESQAASNPAVMQSRMLQNKPSIANSFGSSRIGYGGSLTPNMPNAGRVIS